ncbi:hypothetical protein T4E_12244, partial [Trichinella pseudospiralis]
ATAHQVPSSVCRLLFGQQPTLFSTSFFKFSVFFQFVVVHWNVVHPRLIFFLFFYCSNYHYFFHLSWFIFFRFISGTCFIDDYYLKKHTAVQHVHYWPFFSISRALRSGYLFVSFFGLRCTAGISPPCSVQRQAETNPASVFHHHRIAAVLHQLW